MSKQRHVRPGDHLDDDDTVVIRGGVLDPEVLHADAERYHSIYGEFGISVFAARDATVDELAQQAPLVRFEVLTLVRAGTPARSGLPARADRPQPEALHSRLRRTRRGRGRPRSLRASQLAQSAP